LKPFRSFLKKFGVLHPPNQSIFFTQTLGLLLVLNWDTMRIRLRQRFNGVLLEGFAFSSIFCHFFQKSSVYELSIFGGVVVVPASSDIVSLSQMSGKNIAVVDWASYGGFQMQFRELLHHGIHPMRDLNILFAKSQTKSIEYLRDGLVDASMVRTDQLERMAAAGLVDWNDFRILDSGINATTPYGVFPLDVSTALYPECCVVFLLFSSRSTGPVATFPHVDTSTSNFVVDALVSLGENQDPLAVAARNAGKVSGFRSAQSMSSVVSSLYEINAVNTNGECRHSDPKVETFDIVQCPVSKKQDIAIELAEKGDATVGGCPAAWKEKCEGEAGQFCLCQPCRGAFFCFVGFCGLLCVG
jgi:hypothetical protein